jgi:hypothetical protein
VHDCPECGLGHDGAQAAEPEPVMIEADPGPNENDVKIAEIEAEARVETERIWTEQQELALAAENESLRGELRGIRETLDRVAPPEPEPIVLPEPVPAPAPAPEPEPVPAPPDAGEKPKAAAKKGFF